MNMNTYSDTDKNIDMWDTDVDMDIDIDMDVDMDMDIYRYEGKKLKSDVGVLQHLNNKTCSPTKLFPISDKNTKCVRCKMYKDDI
jgi:hypothetical protein